MARVEESIEIERPVAEVFAYTTDAKSWAKWQSFIPEAEQTSAGPINVGATFKGVSRLMGRSMGWTAIAVEYESNRKWAKNITSGNMAIEEHMTYGPFEGGTTFMIAYNMKADGLFKLLLPLMAGTVRKETRKSLNTLKTILEASTR